MTIDATEAIAEAPTSGRPMAADRLPERLADIVGGRASVRAVFGEPVRHGDLTVIPVARVRWGFGGGGGSTDAQPGGPASGSGGGGGVAADPMGYLEIGPHGAAFQPIRERYPSPVLVIASGVSAALVIRALARLLRGA